MDERNEHDDPIGKMIRKRKEENEAFLRLLQAMNEKTKPEPRSKSKRKPKS
jgi:hypothetical protein